MTVEVQSLPCLCIYAESDTPTYASSEDGHLVNLVLWYVFDLPIPDVTPEGRPVPSAERAENWKEAVWHRVCYWLRQMRFPGEVDDEFVSFDLADEGKIDSLVPKRCEYFPPGVIGGFKATVEMVRTGPPYARPSPLLLKLIDVTLTNDPLDGPDVGAEIEVNT